jgi:hypothetical protein
MPSHTPHQHLWTSHPHVAIHCSACGALLEPYIAKLEQETTLLRARRVHLSESIAEATEANERLAHKNAALQAQLARALDIIQAVAERRMPNYNRELDAWVCDSCDQEGQSHQAFRQQATCAWDQARALRAEEGTA